MQWRGHHGCWARSDPVFPTGQRSEVLNRSKRRKRREWRLRFLRYLLWTHGFLPRVDVDFFSFISGPSRLPSQCGQQTYPYCRSRYRHRGDRVSWHSSLSTARVACEVGRCEAGHESVASARDFRAAHSRLSRLELRGSRHELPNWRPVDIPALPHFWLRQRSIWYERHSWVRSLRAVLRHDRMAQTLQRGITSTSLVAAVSGRSVICECREPNRKPRKGDRY